MAWEVDAHAPCFALLADNVPGTALLAAVARRGAAAQPPAASATARPRDEMITVLYREHYVALVRVAALMLGDVATAEDVVQDAFIATHRAWWRLRDTSRALPYLRRAVMNRARSVLRHRAVVARCEPSPLPDRPSAEEGALVMLERSSVLTALNALPVRQRTVIVLRYYADLSEAQTAAAMGISRGSVKSHAFRALASLRAALR